MKQTLCFQRWVRQEVWRIIVPSIGVNAHKCIGIVRGTIRKIYERPPQYTFKNGHQLHQVEWCADLDWHTAKPKPGVIGEGIFDCGLITPFEMKILIDGGLLQNETVGMWSEPQHPSLKTSVKLYHEVLTDPQANFILAKESVHG